jgi:glycosyltransferase involved in cell wall biosynthesis
LASKIEQLLSDPPLMNRLGANALLRVTSLSIDGTIEATAALYETLLLGGRAGHPASKDSGAEP